jgi:mono/diheme cytochrome c family protein
MSKMKTLFVIFWTTFVLTGGYAGGAALLFAQSVNSTAQSGPKKLTEQEIRGEGVFLQHCSLCHLPLKEKGRTTHYGPPLPGVFKDADPDQEHDLRQIILNGTDRMPAWQYALRAKDIDDLIAYLKTV